MNHRALYFCHSTVSILCACILCIPSILGQKVEKPITRDNLISALKLGSKQSIPPKRYVELINDHGVNFKLSADDEKRIRQAGCYLSPVELDDLITAVRENYRSKIRGVEIDMTLYEESRSFPDNQSTTRTFPSESTLMYSYKRSGAALQIIYGMPYLSLLEQGGPITPLHDPTGNSKLRWRFPKLAIKVVNNSSRTLMFTEAAIDVRSSYVDKQPVLLINPGHYNHSGGRNDVMPFGAFEIVNDGWGNVVNARVDLQISSPDYPQLDGTRRTFNVGTFSELAIINLLKDPSVPLKDCERDKEIKSYYVNVSGEIDYHDESNKRRLVKFQTPVNVVSCGMLTGPSNPNAIYDVQLEAGKSGYTKYVPLAQEVKPGQTDYFLINVGSDKTAQFDLNLSFRTLGIEVPEKRVQINIFVPRSQAKFTQESLRR